MKYNFPYFTAFSCVRSLPLASSFAPWEGVGENVDVFARLCGVVGGGERNRMRFRFWLIKFTNAFKRAI